ncbi:hypothetical protein SMACR_05498 [Sordaria macrospora]|uniref:WGS project CABT00000000 data, contig 2.26 n=2 Tax=Sordaria macrospora TaxID=5147 RepID=F7W3W8_SORMK|nr:uncharacterized protein SMAC_05498 [Sordaria macrospora k-hell]KAA8634274.1 hypothetical protein SMACR_05498 [Sordaria macrospora]KAH7633969.1 hypothetical protein B0T09DRAFT_335042 [Sordaria sp. MPI-SDFR-AT-0083]WPJ59677.1 hypothetical protein SMAC4_05498 [Sordaria macrospora]CCC12321.1 unnamed protein product [Sordaria macrospora k-hell]
MVTPTPIPSPGTPAGKPPLLNYILSFLLVGLAWGFTTPFLRRAAKAHNPPSHPLLERESVKRSAVKRKTLGAWFAVTDLVRNWRYSVPLGINLSGSLWFFLLVGGSELSLTVPIVNTTAFLFTVIGEWYVEGKVISRDTMLGMFLCLGGIALCVQSKQSV